MQSFIGLGGNVGTVEDTFRTVLRELDDADGVRVQRASSFFRTQPMGQAAGEAYLNAAAELSVELAPLELLDLLQSLETHHGRTRESHWGPRTLDLDLLLYEQIVLDHPRLLLPHPGCWYRRFVLDPLAEIANEVPHPVKKRTIGELRERLLERPLSVGLAGGLLEDRTLLAEELSANVPDAQVMPWNPNTPTSPVLLLWLGTPSDIDIAYDDLPPLSRLDLAAIPQARETAARNVISVALGS